MSTTTAPALKILHPDHAGAIYSQIREACGPGATHVSVDILGQGLVTAPGSERVLAIRVEWVGSDKVQRSATNTTPLRFLTTEPAQDEAIRVLLEMVRRAAAVVPPIASSLLSLPASR